MPATKAQALVKGLIVMDADPGADAEALERLAIWALTLRADRRGRPARRSGDRRDRRRASPWRGRRHARGDGRAACRAGIAARAASPTAGAPPMPWRAMRRGRSLVVPPGESAKPCSTCRSPPCACRRHGRRPSRTGFRAIGELAAKPRAPLALRFGPELGRRLDQAMGRLSEPIDPVRPPDLVEVRRGFAEPIGAAETIARYTGKLVGQLCDALEAKGLGARRLDLLFHRVDNRIEAIRVGTALPVRDVKRLTRLLCDKIETVDPGFGIEMMSLAATARRALATKQTISSLVEEPEAGCLRPDRHPRQPRRRTPALPLRPGRQRRAGALGAADRAAGAATGERLARPLAAARAAAAAPGADRDRGAAARPSARQLHLARRPPPRDARRRAGAHLRRMVEARRRTDAVRDYFQVEDEAGERFWIFRAGDGEDAATGSHRWFLHGIFG